MEGENVNKVKLYFSDFFNIKEDIIENYGALDISLVSDMPLFIDPFLLFNSEKIEYKEIHNNIIKYLFFLKEKSQIFNIEEPGFLSSLCSFSEVKQTWLGFSSNGNNGRGLGKGFGTNLHRAFNGTFKTFGEENILECAHLEKLCLIDNLVGKDKISDFTTNFVKKYLLEYTSKFAIQYLTSSQYKEFNVAKVEFNYKTKTWVSKKYLLPCFDNDFVLLTPIDILTKDDTFINKNDMIKNIEKIAPSISNEAIRFQLKNYFIDALSKKRLKLSFKEKKEKIVELIDEYPEILDYYIKHKEDSRKNATLENKKSVEYTKEIFNENIKNIIKVLLDKTEFYSITPNSYEESYKRVLFLKNVIEDMDGYRIFYSKGKPIKSEKHLHIMYRLVWYATIFDVNCEVNNGRGPVDFKVSNGAFDSSLVEFKLASNSKLKNNLAKQVDIYKKANNTKKAIKVILYFNESEYNKVKQVLKSLDIENSEDIILIDASNKKLSASNVKM